MLVIKGCTGHLSKHDPEHWEKAKRAVQKQYGISSGDRFWSIVNTVYQNMSHYIPKGEKGKYRWKPTGGKTSTGMPKATKVRIKKAPIRKLKSRVKIKPAPEKERRAA